MVWGREIRKWLAMVNDIPLGEAVKKGVFFFFLTESGSSDVLYIVNYLIPLEY